MNPVKWTRLLMLGLASSMAAEADGIGRVSTTWRLWADDQVRASASDDPKVPGVTGHLSHARTGGFKATVGVAEDRSRVSIACRQVGPITIDPAKRPDEDEAYSERTSIRFTETRVVRLVDRARRTLAIATKSRT